MLKSKSKYYYTKLDEESKKIYDSILSSWEARNPDASFAMNPLNKNPDIQKILEYIKIDNPGLFYIDYKRLAVSGFMGKASVNASFLYSNSQIDNIENQLEAVIASVTAPENFKSLDNYGKETALYDYLVKNVSYAFGSVNDETTSVTGALLSKKAVCEGYSRAFKLLCDNCGLSCIIATGTAVPPGKQEEPHAWNIVKIDNACAHIDVTWDSGNRNGRDTCYDNFNLTDTDAEKDHVWNRALLPACSSPHLNYYVKNGLCAANRDEFISIVKSQAKTGKKIISLKMTGKEAASDQLMKAANEALRGITPAGQRIGFQYSINRRTATISLL